MTLLKSVMAAIVACGTAFAQQDAPLNVSIISGHDAVVSTHEGRGADIRIRVTDSANKPVEHASVTAILPGIGAGGSFRGGHTIKTETTGSDGEAGFSGISIRRVTGEIPIRIVAHRGKETASTTVRQKATDAAPSREAGRPRRRAAMMAIAAAGVTAGVLVAILGSDDPAPPAFNVTPGFPVTAGPR